MDDWVAAAVAGARVARLATVDVSGDVRLVPICFAVVNDWVVGAVDHKPKRTGQLRRLDDMVTAGTATLLIDHYDEDWTQLWWVRIRGRAEVLAADDRGVGPALRALVAKYEQYSDQPPAGAVYRIAMDEIRWWRWTQGPPVTPRGAPFFVRFGATSDPESV